MIGPFLHQNDKFWSFWFMSRRLNRRGKYKLNRPVSRFTGRRYDPGDRWDVIGYEQHQKGAMRSGNEGAGLNK